MDEKEKVERAEALRQGLRNGRTDKASAVVDSDGGNNDPTFGATFQDAGREVSSLVGNGKQARDDNRQPASNGRSTSKKPERHGQSGGRSSEGDSSTTGNPAGTEPRAAVGRIVTDEPIPERRLDPEQPQATFSPGVVQGVHSESTASKLSSKYPQLNMIMTEQPSISVRSLAESLGVSVGTAQAVKKEWEAEHKQASPKEPFQNPFKGLTTGGKVLSEKEANEITGSFTAALASDFDALDSYLWMRQKAAGIDTQQQPIWSDVDEEELEALTRLMIRWGKRSPTAATVVRATIESADYIAVGTIFIPRIKNTVDTMKQTRQPQPRRGQKGPTQANEN